MLYATMKEWYGGDGAGGSDPHNNGESNEEVVVTFELYAKILTRASIDIIRAI